MNIYLKNLQVVNNRYNDQVLKYCSNIFKCFNLNHFWHYKLTNKGHISFIGSHADWCEYFASEKLFNVYPSMCHPKYHRQRVYLHKHVKDPGLKQVYDACESKYGIRQSLVFVNKTSEGVEEFGFASSSESDIQTADFITELPLFKLFIEKFREEKTALLSKLGDLQVNIGELIGPSFYQKREQDVRNSEKVELLRSLGSEVEDRLSMREVEVLRLVLRGYSARKMADELFLAKRTVEHHLERIKVKLGCHSKSDLVQKARELESLGCFEDPNYLLETILYVLK